jgi:xanthine dehydrogenase accessory factor
LIAADQGARTRALWLTLVLGGGDLGTGVAHRLSRCGFAVVVGELPQPTVVRRTVAFASAVYEGHVEIEGIHAVLAADASEAKSLIEQGVLPVMTSSAARLQSLFCPDIIVDARMAKRNLSIRISDAPIVVGLGPGFAAGEDVHAVIETNRGHGLGRVILAGAADANTGIPGPVQGHARDRVLWSPCRGTLQTAVCIGDAVSQGQLVASVSGTPILAPIEGVVRGLAHQGLEVQKGQKVGDIDPRGVRDYCFSISDKARAVAGGVLEAILLLQRRLTSPA